MLDSDLKITFIILSSLNHKQYRKKVHDRIVIRFVVTRVIADIS